MAPGGNSITASTGTNWADPVHDAAGNMITIPSPQSPASSLSLKFDPWNRLVEVKNSSYAVLTTNEYDGLGRRVRRVDVAANPDVAYDYFYNEQWQVLEERKNADTDPLSQFVWHPYYMDALAVRYWDYNTDGDYLDNYEGDQYFLHDANFNITALANASGTVLERYAYSPYGEVTYLNANFAYQTPFLDNNHLYTGRERDPETGLQLNRHRFYHAQMGRWVNKDPIGQPGAFKENQVASLKPLLSQYISSDSWADNNVEADGYNLYQYVRGNPALGLDPEGLWELRCRKLRRVAGTLGQKHCWVECEGHSYSLLPVEQGDALGNPIDIGRPVIDDPDDLGQGEIVTSGEGECACIGFRFGTNSGGYPYSFGDCNSNWFAHQLLETCGISVSRPSGAYGWDKCKRKQCEFKVGPFPVPKPFPYRPIRTKPRLFERPHKDLR